MGTQSFRRDDQANVLWLTLGALAVVVIPVLLFLLLLRYLKASAPEGTLATAVPEAAPKLQATLEGPASRVAGARKCQRCGVAVKPHKGGGGASECPNCGANLT